VRVEADHTRSAVIGCAYVRCGLLKLDNNQTRDVWVAAGLR
jgi:hypothetical protein